MAHCNVWATQWALASFACLAVSQSKRRDGATPQRALLVLAGIGAALATFGVGNGMASWLALLAMAAAARFPLRAALGLVAGLVACLAVYAIDLERGAVAPRMGLRIALEAPLTAAHFVATFVGSIWGWTASALGWGPLAEWSSFFGVAGLLGFVAFGIAVGRDGLRSRPLSLMALGIMAFGVATAGIVALARLPFNAVGAQVGQSTAIRFLYWSALFWVGAVLALPALSPRRRVTQGATIALLVLVCVVMLAALEPVRQHAMRRKAIVAEGWSGLLLGLRDDAVLHAVAKPYRDLATVRRVADRLERERRSLFATPRADLAGQSLRDRFRIAPPGRCTGRIGPLRRLPGLGGTVRARGLAWDVQADEAPRFVVLTNARDVIVGLASMEPHGETSAGQAAWSGYGIDLRARRPWGILADGRTACRLEAPRADAGSDP